MYIKIKTKVEFSKRLYFTIRSKNLRIGIDGTFFARNGLIVTKYYK